MMKVIGRMTFSNLRWCRSISLFGLCSDTNVCIGWGLDLWMICELDIEGIFCSSTGRVRVWKVVLLMFVFEVQPFGVCCILVYIFL